MNSKSRRNGLLATTVLALVAGCAGKTTAPAATETVDILFLGDTGHAESYHAQYEAEGKGNIIREKGYDYSLAKLKPILDVATDIVVNIETPLTSLREPPYPDKAYNHWSEPHQASESYLRHGFSAISLANNHTLDFGVPGLLETLQTLDQAGIPYFGAGLNKARADAPFERIYSVGSCDVAVAVFGRFEFRDSYQSKYDYYAGASNPGASALMIDELATDIRAAKARNPGGIVVVYPHWGKNYAWRSQTQENHAKAMVAAGADLVLGHGAHTLGEVMVEGDALVVYSLGNFVFNTWGRFPDNPGVLPMSMIARLTLYESGGYVKQNLRLYPIFSDNRIVRYQPRFVDETEFQQVLDTLRSKTNARTVIEHGKDAYGYYMVIPLAAKSCPA